MFRFWHRKELPSGSFKVKKSFSTNKTVATFSNLGEVLSNSILSAVQTVVMIGGFVVLFSVLLSILENSHTLGIISGTIEPILSIFNIDNPAFAESIVSGIIELTNGVKLVSIIPCKQISVNIIITAFLLGFGGISIMLQVLSIISKSDISIKPYIIGKLVQGIFAGLYTFIFIYAFPIFNLNL